MSRPLRVVGERVRGRWRRSLQIRVAVTTLCVSASVVVLLGGVLLSQVGQGLLEAKVRAAQAETGAGLAYARNQLLGPDVPSDEGSVEDRLQRLVGFLAARGSAGDLYDVVLLPGSPSRNSYQTGCAMPDHVPVALQARVTGPDRPDAAYTVTTRRCGGTEQETLVVGGPVVTPTDNRASLYYLFPLTAEADTLRLVTRTALGASAVLVLLLVGIAALVTRQVVSPVRAAAASAERMSTGRLDARMKVRGEDDLARLATTYNRMAESLQAKIGELEELSRVQRRFVSDVSHELRTPLTTVRMAADLLYAQRPAFAPEVARSAELLQAELDRFETMLADLLEISRFDALAAVLEPEPTDLGALVRRTADAAQLLADRRGTCLDLSGVPAQPVLADVDPRRVERVLRNLLVNAVEHGEGRPVSVTLAGDDETVAITVRDRGVGLKPGEAALAFTRFWRGDPSRARQTGGTGLGLAISLEDARLHGGWLQAWGAPGVGAQFRLTLPRRAGATVTRSPLPLEPLGVLPTPPAPVTPAATVVAPPAGSTLAPDPAPALSASRTSTR